MIFDFIGNLVRIGFFVFAARGLLLIPDRQWRVESSLLTQFVEEEEEDEEEEKEEEEEETVGGP